MSGVVSFFWLDSSGDAHHMRIPRDEVREIARDGDDEIEITLHGCFRQINIDLDPAHADHEDEALIKLGNKIIDSIRALTDEDVSWEFDGDRWNAVKAKNESVWGLSR